MRRIVVRLMLLAGLAAMGGSATGATYSAFSGQTANGANTFTASSAFPIVVRSAIIDKGSGCSPGYVSVKGAPYRVYANVSGTPSGVTANVAVLTAGQSAAALTGGNFPLGSIAYNYRSALLGVDTNVGEGSASYSVAPGGGTASTKTVVVDGTKPGASDIQASSNTGVPRKAEAGETITMTFDDAMDLCSLLPAWDGSARDVVVRFNDNASPSGPTGSQDTITLWNAANTAQVPLFDHVNLNRQDYVGTGGATFGASGTPSTLTALSPSSFRITLGTPAGAVTQAAAAATMSVNVAAAATDRAGNPTAGNTSESGALDPDF